AGVQCVSRGDGRRPGERGQRSSERFRLNVLSRPRPAEEKRMSTLTMQPPRRLSRRPRPAAPILLVGLALALPGLAAGQAEAPKGPPGGTKAPSSYDQVTPALLGQKPFEAMKAEDEAEKPAVL